MHYPSYAVCKCLKRWRIASLNIDEYNHERPHQSDGYKVRFEIFNNGQKRILLKAAWLYYRYSIFDWPPDDGGLPRQPKQWMESIGIFHPENVTRHDTLRN